MYAIWDSRMVDVQEQWIQGGQRQGLLALSAEHENSKYATGLLHKPQPKLEKNQPSHFTSSVAQPEVSIFAQSMVVIAITPPATK